MDHCPSDVCFRRPSFDKDGARSYWRCHRIADSLWSSICVLSVLHFIFFRNRELCNVFIIISGFLIGMGGTIAVEMLYIFGEPGNGTDGNENLLNVATIITWILRFHPSFCLGKGLYNAMYIQAYEFWQGKQLSVWSEPVLLLEVIFLACEAVVYLVLAYFIDKWSANPRMVSIWRKFIRIVTCRCFCVKHDRDW